MIINSANIELAFRGFHAVFKNAFAATPSLYEKIAMVVPSTTSQEEYGWLGQFPQVREWIGERHIKNLTTHGFTIRNKDFESTVTVMRNDMADDRLGIYGPMFAEMGRVTKMHPDEMVFGLLRKGFVAPSYDGQPFFSDSHSWFDARVQFAAIASNYQHGDDEPWYLMDLSKAIKPMIFQEREKYTFQAIRDEADPNVFLRNEYLFGIRARLNVGFGLWQLAFGSKAELSRPNFVAARNLMAAYRGDQGNLLGITPTHLVVPPNLEEAAREMLKPNLANGESNIWANAVQLIVSHHLG